MGNRVINKFSILEKMQAQDTLKKTQKHTYVPF